MKIKYYIAVAVVMTATVFSSCKTKDEIELISLAENESSNYELTADSVKELYSDESISKQDNSNLINLEKQNYSDPEISQKNSQSDTKENDGKIYIYICGAVIYPDVYELAQSARVVDAVNLAGGLREDAAVEYINLASNLADGQKIFIPSYEEIEQGLVSVNDLITESVTGSNISSSGVANSDAVTTSGSSDNGKINLNTATQEELMTIPGIGQSKADKIINYRNENGGFTTIEDIMFISGIKEGMFNKIKDYITV